MILIACDVQEPTVNIDDSDTEEPIVELDNSNGSDDSKDKPLSEHIANIETLIKPAIHLLKTQEKTISKLGGISLAKPNFQWPVWQGKPLSLLLQIDLSELPQSALTERLPPQGLLSFYYDSEQRTWGYDPKDKGSWKVVYDKNVKQLKPIKAPDNAKVYPQSFISYAYIRSYPDTKNTEISELNFNDTQNDQYEELKYGVFDQLPQHQLFGYPSVIQNNNMDLSSQLASNGIYLGTAAGYNSEKAKSLAEGRSDWELLLQFDTDESNGIMWGDSGTLYFWIRSDDLKQQNFENVWMKLQSY